MNINNTSSDALLNPIVSHFGAFVSQTLTGPDHSIRESLLVLATLMGYFVHMQKKTKNKSHIFLYLAVVLICPAYLLSR